MVALERGVADQLDLQKVVVCPLPHYPGWSDDNEFVGGHNPVGKIPVLVLDDDNNDDQSNRNVSDSPTALFDSRVICDYFDSLASTSSSTVLSSHDKKTWIDRTLQTTALSLLDAEVLCVYEDRLRVEKNIFYQEWKDGQRIKIHRCLDFLDRAVQRGDLVGGEKGGKGEGDITTAEICIASALAFLDMRVVEWRVTPDGERREALEGYWERKWKERKSLKWTEGDNDWKLGKKIEAGGFKAF